MIQQNNYRIMDTDELLNYVKACSLAHDQGKRDNAVVEAELHGKGIKSTHFLEFYEHRLYDEGCDGYRIRTSMKQFRKQYPKANWALDERQ